MNKKDITPFNDKGEHHGYQFFFQGRKKHCEGLCLNNERVGYWVWFYELKRDTKYYFIVT